MITKPLPAPVAPRHTLVEDALGLVTGSFLASIGLFLLHAGGLITGGTVGLGLLLGRLTHLPYALVWVAVTAPFVFLAVSRKGWLFTLRSAIAVALVALFSLVHPHLLMIENVNPVYAALAGNLASGVGLLIVFRNNSTLGGFNVVALLCQERLGWRAGYVQLVLDSMVIVLACAVVPIGTALLSAAGAVVLNVVIAQNHRPGRYTAG